MSASVSLTDHFKRLFDFGGREDRASFWPFAALAFIITMVGGMIIFMPMMIGSLAAMQQFAAQHPDQATITSGPGHYSISVEGNHPEFMPADSIALFLAVTFGLGILLYAAAVVRRLHDGGKSGLWGLMPLPFIIYSSVQMPRVFGAAPTGDQPDMTLFFSIFLSNLFYIVTLIWLIVLLAGPAALSWFSLVAQCWPPKSNEVDEVEEPPFSLIRSFDTLLARVTSLTLDGLRERAKSGS